MAGHSKWSKIKHKKAINDAKRGKTFSKLLQQITTAAREGGPDMDSNPTLRLLVDKAKSESLPKSNIERAIQRGAGISKDGKSLETVYYEGFSSNGVGIIVETITDNTNRTVSELRTIFSRHGGRLGDNGSVSWNFENIGRILLACGRMKKSEKYGEPDIFEPIPAESIIEKLFDVNGINDISDPYRLEDKELIEIITEPTVLNDVRSVINENGWIIEEIELTKLVKTAKNEGDINMESLTKLVEELEAHEDVQRVWTELK